MKPILKLFSYIFHPLFVSVYATLYFFYSYRNIFPAVNSIYYIVQITLLTIILPLFILHLYINLKIINSDIMLTDVKSRRLPLATQSIIFLFICHQTLKPIQGFELKYFFIGALISSVIALLATLFKQKISLHMIGICGMATFIIGLNIKIGFPSLVLICTLFIISGLVATSRLIMKAHTNLELLLGALIGVFTQILSFYIFYKI